MSNERPYTCEECGRSSAHRLRLGRCASCYQRHRRMFPRPPRLAPRDRILANIELATTGCWLWRGGRDKNTGYGQVSARLSNMTRATTVGAHRAAYEIFVGRIPSGLHLDHLCRVRHCVNPDHLEPVTAQENTLRSPIAVAAGYANRTECQFGHEFSPENTQTIRRADNPEKTYRACKTCARERVRRVRERKPTVEVAS